MSDAPNTIQPSRTSHWPLILILNLSFSSALWKLSETLRPSKLEYSFSISSSGFIESAIRRLIVSETSRHKVQCFEFDLSSPIVRCLIDPSLRNWSKVKL